jgi:hypothetical protein
VTKLLSFPDPVNETSARIVAAGVVVLSALFALTANGWLLTLLVYGFAARVLTGPTLSPLGQIATRVVTPRLRGPHRSVPGPPKRFAQGVGLVFSGAAALSYLVGNTALAQILALCLLGAASLEAFAAVCLGCLVYNRIWGCADCDDISDRLLDRVNT